jgi:hypothetical protein
MSFNHSLVIITGILAVVALEIVALYLGFNGTGLAAALAAIGGMAGAAPAYAIGKKRGQEGK